MRRILFIIIIALSFKTYGQTINQVSIKAGANISGRTYANSGHQAGIQKLGFLLMIEPTFYTFGAKKQFHFNTDISLFEKGYTNRETVYTYNEFGNVTSVGHEVYSFSMFYFGMSPNIKYNFAKIGFIKAGLTGDYLLTEKYNGNPNSQFKGSNEFLLFAAGASFGGGVCVGKKNIKFIGEIMGQKDFISSTYNSSTREYFRNYSYYINCGVSININKKSAPPAGS